ncbi:MAG TPA: glycosyltransferase family 87 protein [Pyrinomonadaceae bacterium]
MKLRKGALDNLVLIAGAILFFWLLTLPKFSGVVTHYQDSLRYASSTLKGEMPFSDFASMIVGFRALYNRTEPYPVLGVAFKDLGIDWPVTHGSNYPPTCYLFAAPVAFFNWPVASALWAWLMLCLLVLSYRFYGLSWRMALGLMPFTLLWVPASASLGQATIIWVFGLALAYRFRGKELLWSGASIGLASISKYMPGLMMILFLLKRKWRAIAGFVAVWVLALTVVVLMNPAAIPRYFEENRTTSFFLMQRTDNTAPLIASFRHGGIIGVGLLLLLFAAIIFVNRRYFYDWKTFPSMRAWMLVTYFSVVILPIFFIYSLMPLLPVIIYLLSERKIATTLISIYCLLISSIYIQGGEQSVLPIASVSIFTGLAFVLDQLPLKIFQQRWLVTAGDKKAAAA